MFQFSLAGILSFFASGINISPANSLKPVEMTVKKNSVAVH